MKKSQTIQIMTTTEQKEKIKKLAKARNMNVSQFVLSRCLKADLEDRVEDMFREIMKKLKGGKQKQ